VWGPDGLPGFPVLPDLGRTEAIGQGLSFASGQIVFALHEQLAFVKRQSPYESSCQALSSPLRKVAVCPGLQRIQIAGVVHSPRFFGLECTCLFRHMKACGPAWRTKPKTGSGISHGVLTRV